MDPLETQLARLRPQLLRLARNRLRNPCWAEDAVSETLLAALQRRPDIDDERRLRAWLFGVLRHKVADQLREHLGGERTWMPLDDDEADAPEIGDPSPQADPLQRVRERQFIVALDHELRRLPPAQAEAFVLRECLGGEAAEICDTLAITSNHLWVMLHRARHRLRERLAAYAA